MAQISKVRKDSFVSTAQLQRAWVIYRNLAWVVGAALTALTFIALPYVYILDNEKNAWTIAAWTAHGWIFPIYLLATLNLSSKLRWSLGKTLLVMLAGTVPLMSFVAERRVAHELAAQFDTPPLELI